MSRLIDADKLKQHYAWWEIGDGEITYAEAKKRFDTIIDVQPTVDAEPIKHGHWSLNPHNRAWDVCSACGFGTKRREYGINPDGTEYVTEYSYRYCPNCGAKMSRERKEDAETD